MNPNALPDQMVLLDLYASLTSGGLLGEGASRAVYAAGADSIVKVEKPGFYQNMNEWMVWQMVQNTPLEKYFAPCTDLSPNGRWLWMDRVQPVANRGDFKLPAVFNEHDVTDQNLGWYKGRIVIFDYGYEVFDFKKLLKGIK